MADFVQRRLLGSLSAADRAFVCELSVFDRTDAELVDEVLGSSGFGTRMASAYNSPPSRSAADPSRVPIARSFNGTRARILWSTNPTELGVTLPRSPAHCWHPTNLQPQTRSRH